MADNDIKEQKKSKRGRKTRLTRKFIDKAEKLLQCGNYVVTVCQILGICQDTWYKWIRWGDERPGSIYTEFADRVKSAEAIAEVKAVSGVLQAGNNGSWQAYAWYLERKHWQRWRRREGEQVKDTKDPILDLLEELKGESANVREETDSETD